MSVLFQGATTRWTEHRQGLRMLKPRDVLRRWESGSVRQLEAAELLGEAGQRLRQA